VVEAGHAGRKSRERTIGEVMGHLDNWKRIYRNLGEKGEMITLQQAA
jgi:hypothetical protein